MQTSPEGLVLVHYGNLNNGELLKPTIFSSNEGNKPRGRNLLWTSPINSPYSFKQIAKRERLPHIRRPKWVLELDPNANTAIVDSLADYLTYLKQFHVNAYRYNPRMYKMMSHIIDWENMSKEYDAFWLTQQGIKETNIRYMSPFEGWDCETVVVFNTERVKIFE